MGSARRGDAKLTQEKERKDIVSSIQNTKRPALLQTAAMVLLHVGFAMRTGQEGFARLLGAIQVLSKTACVQSMAPMGSARLTIARLLLLQEDFVSGMAVAASKCATLRAARLVPKHVAVASGTVRMAGARWMNAPPRHDKGSSIASHTVAGRSAPWRAAPPPLIAKASVANMAVAARKCATLKAARLVPKHVAVAEGMVRMAGARWMDAPPRHDKGSSIASHTAVGRSAPWRAAPPPLIAKASVVNMVAAKRNAGSWAAPAKVTAFSRPARRTAGEGTASTHQDASRLQQSTAQTARSTPRRRRRIERQTNGERERKVFSILEFVVCAQMRACMPDRLPEVSNAILVETCRVGVPASVVSF